MSERNDSHEPAEQDQPADVLTGEDVVLDDSTFDDDFVGMVDEPVGESLPAPTEQVDPVPAAEAPASEPEPATEAPTPVFEEVTVSEEPLAASEGAATDETAEEPALVTTEVPATEEPPAKEPLAERFPVEEPATEEPAAEEPPAAEPLESDFPATSRVDTASADELADMTSVLDTGFSAPAREDITVDAPRDVLEGRTAQATVGEDGQSLVTVSAEDPAADERVDTTVMRRSLINQGADEAQATEALAAVPTETVFTAVTPTPVSQSSTFDIDSRPDSPGQDFTVLEGATILPTVPSRAGARWLSAVGTLLLIPFAWYLLTDSAVRLVLAVDNPWTTGQVNLAALGEMAGGLAVLLLVALLATQSSLGLFLTGAALVILGVPFLVAPGMTAGALETYISGPLSGLGAFGQNIYFHLTATGATGILLMAGIAMLLAGWGAFRLRRVGRAEEALRAEVASINPDGIRARWARKATTAHSRRH